MVVTSIAIALVSRNRAIDLQAIWNRQELPEELKEALFVIALKVSEAIKATLSHLFFKIKHRHPNPLSSWCAPACRVPWRRRAVAPHAASCPGRTLTERCYFPTSQSCLEAFINEAHSSGGVPRASILAKTVYGSILLPDERSVDLSLTHA